MKDCKMQPTSILQWIILRLGGTSVQYPKKCALCGTKTKGNIITGYYMPCLQSHQIEWVGKLHAKS